MYPEESVSPILSHERYVDTQCGSGPDRRRHCRLKQKYASSTHKKCCLLFADAFPSAMPDSVVGRAMLQLHILVAIRLKHVFVPVPVQSQYRDKNMPLIIFTLPSAVPKLALRQTHLLQPMASRM